MAGRLMSAAALLAAARAQVECDQEGTCSYSVAYHSSTLTFDFRRLCNAGGDYTLMDDQGHTYYAQICGLAAKKCLPHMYETEYEYGRVVQAWGSPPSCDNTCVESRTGAPVCCTEDCEVTGVYKPNFQLIDPNNPKAGMRLTYTGATPTRDDTYSCPVNPSTGVPYPRVSHMEFYCDPNVDGYANFYEVDQNATNGCDYTLKFKTSLVCISDLSLSGGWIFSIIVLSSFAAYVIIGTLWTYRVEKIWAFPNRQFWAEVESLIFDGIMFTARCFRKRPSGTTSSFMKEEPKPLFSSAASTGGGGESASFQTSTSTGARNAYTEL